MHRAGTLVLGLQEKQGVTESGVSKLLPWSRTPGPSCPLLGFSLLLQVSPQPPLGNLPTPLRSSHQK